MATPATVFLEQQNIAFEVCRYEHDPAAASYGMEAAEVLDLDPNVVFKTLMAQLGDEGPLVVAVVPVAEMLDLKALARAAGVKRAKMASVADAERSSGYVAGGISPFGQKRQLGTYVDESAEICDVMYVSGGQRGLDLALAPTDLITSVNATVVALC